MKLEPKVVVVMTRYTLFVPVLVQLMVCSNPTGLNLDYNPPVVFSGIVNGDDVTLSGNRFWPNSCVRVNDTIRMYFYSTTFSETNKIRKGDLLRIDFFPDHDTLIGKKDILFHLARYNERNNSYNISPKDSSITDKIVQMHVVSLSASHGHQVNIDYIYILTSSISSASGPQLEIKNGTITGVVE